MQIILGILAAASLLLFFPLNMRNGDLLRRKSRLDPYIPFLPVFIVPYLALFPFIFFSFFAVLSTPSADRFYLSMIFAGLGGAAIWYFRPRGVERPVVALKGPFSRLVAWTYSHDPRYNAFPSSHVFTAFLCSYYLVTVYPTHDILIWGTGSTIMASTLLVKQHHLIDVFGGLAVAVLSIGASYFLIGGIA